MDAYVADLFARCVVRPAQTAQTAVTAGGSGDATAVNGLVLNLDEIMTNGQRSIAAVICGVATVADTKALTMAAKWRQADDLAFSVNVEDLLDAFASTTIFTASGAQTAKPFGIVLPLNYERVTRKYIRIQYTPDMTASGTDTATINSVYLIGQGQDLPPSKINAWTNAS